MADVKYDGASRVYPGSPPVRAVDTLNLDIPDGEFLVLVGPSGSGKSTALRMLAGLEDINEGRIIIGGRDVTNVPPKNRDIAMVFQSYALYPHMTVAENMGFALKLRGVNKTEIASKVREAAGLLDLEKYLDRKPKALSGGQRQRVAMGRAIVREPSVFLMDEPLSNLDAKLRVETRANIAELQARLGTTTVYVTHDQVEAMTMGHRVAVLKDGILQQCDTPRTLYDKPDNVFVAGFMGSPVDEPADRAAGQRGRQAGRHGLPAAARAARRGFRQGSQGGHLRCPPGEHHAVRQGRTGHHRPGRGTRRRLLRARSHPGRRPAGHPRRCPDPPVTGFRRARHADRRRSLPPLRPERPGIGFKASGAVPADASPGGPVDDRPRQELTGSDRSGRPGTPSTGGPAVLLFPGVLFPGRPGRARRDHGEPASWHPAAAHPAGAGDPADHVDRERDRGDVRADRQAAAERDQDAADHRHRPEQHRQHRHPQRRRASPASRPPPG